jgi:hypothetical protein
MIDQRETNRYERSTKLPQHGNTLRRRSVAKYLNTFLAVLIRSAKQLSALFCSFGKLPDDVLENSAHLGIATRAVSIARVDAICTLALLASMPFVVHTPLFLLRDRLEAPELVGYLATSEERFKHGGLAVSQRLGYLLLHELLEDAGVYLRPSNHPRRENDFRVWLPSSIPFLLGHR